MTLKDATKLLFAQAMEDLLKTEPLSEVSVTSLCEKCDVPRQTFYYHFKDKYDLIAWIFMQDFDYASLPIYEYEPVEYEKQMTKLLDCLQKKKEFYCHVLKDTSQNSLYGYILEYDIEFAKQILQTKTQKATPSPEEMFTVLFNTYGGLASTFEWLLGNIDLPTERFAKLLCGRMRALDV